MINLFSVCSVAAQQHKEESSSNESEIEFLESIPPPTATGPSTPPASDKSKLFKQKLVALEEREQKKERMREKRKERERLKVEKLAARKSTQSKGE